MTAWAAARQIFFDMERNHKFSRGQARLGLRKNRLVTE
jgi:hypothetical protein